MPPKHPPEPSPEEFGPHFDQINFEVTDFISGRYNPEAPVKERFLTWWGAYAEFVNARPFDLIFMEQLTNSHLYKWAGQQKSSSYYHESRRILEEAQKQGLIKMEPLSLLNQFVRGAIINVIRFNFPIGKTLSPYELEWLVQSCWDGISTQKAGK
jgi:hypothetical protein